MRFLCLAWTTVPYWELFSQCCQLLAWTSLIDSTKTFGTTRQWRVGQVWFSQRESGKSIVFCIPYKKNCAKRHIRPLYVNFGGDIVLFCVWFWVWHSSVQPLFISFSLTWMASTIFCLRGAHRPRPQWRWYFRPIRGLENVTWQNDRMTDTHFDIMTTNALRAAAVKIQRHIQHLIKAPKPKEIDLSAILGPLVAILDFAGVALLQLLPHCRRWAIAPYGTRLVFQP